MDQHKKQLSSMDPKLKEAYEKVMNTPIASSGTATLPQTDPQIQQPASSPTPIPNEAMTLPLQEQDNKGLQTPLPAISPIEAPSVSAAEMPLASAVNPNSGVNSSPGVQLPPPTVHIDYTLKKPPSSNISFGRKKLGIPPALYVVGCVLFFILYTLFWLKVFGLPIPYLG